MGSSKTQAELKMIEKGWSGGEGPVEIKYLVITE